MFDESARDENRIAAFAGNAGIIIEAMVNDSHCEWYTTRSGFFRKKRCHREERFFATKRSVRSKRLLR
jgi:hypothetical protein